MGHVGGAAEKEKQTCQTETNKAKKVKVDASKF